LITMHLHITISLLFFCWCSANLTVISIKTVFSDRKSLVRSFQRQMTKLSAGNEQALINDLQFIIEDGPIPPHNRKFLIHGWRWHTKSVLRDLDRFNKVVKNQSKLCKKQYPTQLLSKIRATDTELSAISQKLSSCFNFVYGFNWKALIRVESEIFFPWLKDLLPTTADPIINDILNQHEKIRSIAGRVMVMCNSLQQGQGQGQGPNQPVKIDALIEQFEKIESAISELKECELKIQNIQVFDFFSIYI
jgi:hypothetical protein